MRKREIYVLNCGRRMPQPEVNFIKLFHVPLDLVSVYNIYTSGQSLEKQAKFGAPKIKKMISFLTITGN